MAGRGAKCPSIEYNPSTTMMILFQGRLVLGWPLRIISRNNRSKSATSEGYYGTNKCTIMSEYSDNGSRQTSAKYQG